MRELKYVVAVALLAMSAVLMAGAAYGADGWTVTDQSLPSAMVWDASAAASVDADNSGDTTWDSDYALVSVMGPTLTPTAIDRWGLTSVPVAGTVDPDESYTFDLYLTAPPISTLAYVAPVAPTDSGIVVGFDNNWTLANPYDPPTFVTTDMAAAETVITRFPDDMGGYTFWIEELAGRVPLVVAGYPDGYYRPSWIVTRDQMAVYMARALNLPTAPYEGFFETTDVPISQWAWPWIEALVRSTIVTGYPDGYYRPGWNVDRASMAAYVAFGINGGRDVPSGPAVGDFTDVADYDPGPAYWAYDYIEYCVAHHVVQGFPDHTYRPTNPVTRDQMAVFVWKGFVMPTESAVVIAGPATTSFDPAATNYVGWSTTSVSPSFAYVAFDAVRWDTSLITPGVGTPDWDVCFDIYAYDLDTGRGDLVDTVCTAMTAEDMLLRKEEAIASGDPYLVVSAALPDLDPGIYQLVTRVEVDSAGFVELARAPIFTVGESLPIVGSFDKEAIARAMWDMVGHRVVTSGSDADLAEDDGHYMVTERDRLPDWKEPDGGVWCNSGQSATALIWHGIPADATSLELTVVYHADNPDDGTWNGVLDGTLDLDCCATSCCGDWGVLDEPWALSLGDPPGSGTIVHTSAYTYDLDTAPLGNGFMVQTGSADGGPNWWDTDGYDLLPEGAPDGDDDFWVLTGSGDPMVPSLRDIVGGGDLHPGEGFTGFARDTDATVHWGTADPAGYVNANGDFGITFCGGSIQYLYIDQAIVTYTR